MQQQANYLQQLLVSLRTRLLVMCASVGIALEDAGKAMAAGDPGRAASVIENDAAIDALENEIDEMALQLLARTQPVARDLRFVVSTLRMVVDLERIGDVADKIARMLTDNANKPQPPLVSLENMGRRTIKMLHDVLDAFARMDLEAAIAVYKEDDKVDREYESIIRELMTYMMEDPRTIPQVLNVLWAARAIERVGDRCQHICEYIVYYVKGKDVRHTKADDLSDLLGKG